jgi:hypothetical protein
MSCPRLDNAIPYLMRSNLWEKCLDEGATKLSTKYIISSCTFGPGSGHVTWSKGLHNLAFIADFGEECVT